MEVDVNIFTLSIDCIFPYLVSYYTTHQPDGVHIEARCTCGKKLEE
jgi:hypothetical protein